MLPACLQAQRLNFPLLTDQSDFLRCPAAADHYSWSMHLLVVATAASFQCRKSFGIKADMLGFLPGRQTYVIDKSGKIVMSFNDQVWHVLQL